VNASPERALTFDCGGQRLVGVLHPAVAGQGAKPGVLVIVGGPQYRVGSHRQFVLLARALAAAGYPVLRFDYRGMGDSEGDARTFDSVDDDVRSAIDTLMRELPGLPGVVLWGLCDGASAAMIYASQDARVVGLVTANPWVRTEQAEAQAYVQRYYGARLLQRSFWSKLLTFKVDVAGSIKGFIRTLRTSRGSGGGGAGASGADFRDRMRSGWSSLCAPSLLILSDADLTAAQFRALVSEDARWRDLQQRRDVTTCVLPGADHTFSTAAALLGSTNAVLEWMGSAFQRADSEGAAT
jgi:exosortase A-associated hydrolase 1